MHPHSRRHDGGVGVLLAPTCASPFSRSRPAGRVPTTARVLHSVGVILNRLPILRLSAPGVRKVASRTRHLRKSPLAARESNFSSRFFSLSSFFSFFLFLVSVNMIDRPCERRKTVKRVARPATVFWNFETVSVIISICTHGWYRAINLSRSPKERIRALSYMRVSLFLLSYKIQLNGCPKFLSNSCSSRTYLRLHR